MAGLEEVLHGSFARADNLAVGSFDAAAGKTGVNECSARKRETFGQLQNIFDATIHLGVNQLVVAGDRENVEGLESCDYPGGAPSFRMAIMLSADVSRRNARWPDSISYKIVPSAKMSERASAVSPRACSGDM